jgi:nitric oxide dioxygenase
MKEVLGDAATEEVLNAWEEAYGVIADVFIKVEADLYAKAESQEGGWAGFRAFRVERKEKESENVASFYLVPEDGKEIAGFEPGQYITVRAEIPGEKYVQLRHYSLSDAPGKEYYRISVKREDGNEGQPAGKVSTYLHEHVQQGDVLHLSAPAGDFTLDRKDERPAVFIAGGVGLTPLVSMLKTVVSEQPNRRVTFIHAVKNGNLHPLKNELEELARRHGQLSLRFCYSQPTGADKAKGGYQKEGHVDLPWLKQVVDSPNSAFYFCGPLPFMKAVKGMLREWGVAEADQHFEFFGPAAML